MSSEKTAWPVSTRALRHVIQAADTSASYRDFMIRKLTTAGVFEKETISSLMLGYLIGRHVGIDVIEQEPELRKIMDDITNLDKLPILQG